MQRQNSMHLHRSELARLGNSEMEIFPLTERLSLKGDRVVFGLKSKTMGVRNGTLGTIENIDRLRLSVTVTLDNGKKAYVSLSSYDRIDLAYAVTVHSRRA